MVTFAHVVPGAYDPETETWGAPTTTTVTGAAIRVRGVPETYRAPTLIESQAPTLLFTPTTYGELPALGDTVTWPPVGGTTYTVRDINPIAPDGVAIMARIVVAV